jgi:hypothetical protein
MLARTVIIFGLFCCYPTLSYADCPAERKEADHYEAQLTNDLTCAYDSSYRPVKDHKSAVNVSVRFAIKYISFDSLEETFTVHSWVAMIWKDEFLNWDPANYGNITEMQIESHTIWTPRMSLFNADPTLYQSEDFYTTCLLDYNGTVTCVPHIPHSGICRTSLKYWPYDKQNCTLYFGSWMHTGEQINFTLFKSRPVIMNEYQNGPGWSLLKVVPERLAGVYECCPNVTYPMLKYTFILKRESGGPAAIVIVPSVVIVMMTTLSLLLDVKDISRLVLQCFSLYGHFMYLSEIGYDIPKHSTDTPIILLFIRDSMIITLMSIMLTLLLSSLRRRAVPAPLWVVSLSRMVTSGPGKYVVFTEFDPSESSDNKNLTENDLNEERPTPASDWIMFANILNSFVFVVFALVYLILLCVYIPTDN